MQNSTADFTERLLNTSEAEVAAILEKARQDVQPIVEREREGERIPQGLMEFRMR